MKRMMINYVFGIDWSLNMKCQYIKGKTLDCKEYQGVSNWNNKCYCCDPDYIYDLYLLQEKVKDIEFMENNFPVVYVGSLIIGNPFNGKFIDRVYPT